MNMKRFVIVAVSSLMLLGLSCVNAGAAEGKGVEQNKVGTVKKVDLGAKQLVVVAVRELTFTVTDHTKIMHAGKPKQLADIKVDDMVSVDYMKDGDTRTARKIVIMSGKE